MNILKQKVTPPIAIAVAIAVITIACILWNLLDSDVKARTEASAREDRLMHVSVRLHPYLYRYVMLGECRLYVYDTDSENELLICVSKTGSKISVRPYKVEIEGQK
jgi:hypothetical protein